MPQVVKAGGQTQSRKHSRQKVVIAMKAGRWRKWEAPGDAILASIVQLIVDDKQRQCSRR